MTKTEPSNAARELGQILANCGARMTFDSERDTSAACFNCGTTERPRDLVVVGTWTRAVGNRGIAGDPIERPLCAECARSTQPAADALPVDTLRLTVAALNALSRLGAKTVFDVTQLRPSELLRVRGCGKITVRLIESELAKLGLALRPDPPRPRKPGAKP